MIVIVYSSHLLETDLCTINPNDALEEVKYSTNESRFYLLSDCYTVIADNCVSFAELRGSSLRFPPCEATKPEVPRQRKLRHKVLLKITE